MHAVDLISMIGLAAAPIGELRAAIPFGIVKLDLSWYEAMLLGLLGNMLPVLILPWVLERVGLVMLRSPQPIKGFFIWRVERIRVSASPKIEKYGRIALVPFVATPLPFTGAWTGCLAAWALGIKPKRSIPYLALGVVVAAVLVTLLTELGVSLSLVVGSELDH